MTTRPVEEETLRLFGTGIVAMARANLIPDLTGEQLAAMNAPDPLPEERPKSLSTLIFSGVN